MRKASIDLGTNTCLLLIADRDPAAGNLKTVLDQSTIVRLGQGVDLKKMLQPEAMERTLACLKEYSENVKKSGLNPKDTLCVATSQARDAKNSGDFFERVKKETGFIFQTISGEKEAEYTFAGALLDGMSPDSWSVIDIGGGSTELMNEADRMSLDIGSVRFTERFLKSDPVTDQEFWACQELIDSELEKLLAWKNKYPKASQLVAVAGTATTLAGWHLLLKRFNPRKINEVELTRGDVHRMVEELKWRTVEERKSIPGMEPMRADVILAGALILWRALEVLGFEKCRVSTRGLRYGVIVKNS